MRRRDPGGLVAVGARALARTSGQASRGLLRDGVGAPAWAARLCNRAALVVGAPACCGNDGGVTSDIGSTSLSTPASASVFLLHPRGSTSPSTRSIPSPPTASVRAHSAARGDAGGRVAVCQPFEHPRVEQAEPRRRLGHRTIP